MSEKMFCRLCLISTDEYKPLEGVLNEMVNVLLQNTSLIATESPIICDSCIRKIHKAFEFKLNCVNTEVKLSHYVSSQENGILDLRMVYLVEKDPGKEVHFHENMKICRTCLDMIESGCASLLDTVEINKLGDMFKIYIPELTLTITESPLICEKCIEAFKCFVEFISMSLETENKIRSFCHQIDHEENSQLDLEKIMAPSKEGINEEEHEINIDTEESKIMKLFRDEHLLLDFYSNCNAELDIEENERKIMKMIFEEDIDLFYKERPDFDSIEDEFEDNENDSYKENTFFSSPILSHWDMVESFNNSEYQVLGIDDIQSSIGDDSPQPSSPEETPSSPEILSPKKWFDCKTNGQKTSTDDCPDCEGNRQKKKWCEKCKWKKTVSYNYSNGQTESVKPVSSKKSRKDGRKCRKVYGVEYKEMWCTQCRWKKACTRFGNRSRS